MKENIHIALAEANKWREDAYLFVVSINLFGEEYPYKINYGFAYPGGTDYLDVELAIGNGDIEIAKSIINDKMVISDEILLDEVEYDSQEAFDYIHSRFGLDFLRRYPDGLLVSIDLYVRHDNEPIWGINYIDLGSNSSMYIGVNAITNEVEITRFFDH